MQGRMRLWMANPRRFPERIPWKVISLNRWTAMGKKSEEEASLASASPGAPPTETLVKLRARLLITLLFIYLLVVC